VKKGKARKKHVYKEKSEFGKNKTKDVKFGARFVLRQLNTMINELKADGSIPGIHALVYKEQLFDNKTYTPEQFSRWAKRFKENRKICQAIEKIDSIFKSRAWAGGLQGNLNASMTKFHLINNYGAKESVDITGGMQHTLMMKEIIKRSQEVEE